MTRFELFAAGCEEISALRVFEQSRVSIGSYFATTRRFFNAEDAEDDPQIMQTFLVVSCRFSVEGI